MIIGELAASLGVTPKTLRLYEQRGLIAATSRSENGYRFYGDAAVRRARLVVGLRNMGLPLAAIAEMVDGASSGRAALRRALAGLLSERIRILSEEVAVRQGQIDELEARYLALIQTPKDSTPDCICRALNQECRCVASVERSPRRVS